MAKDTLYTIGHSSRRIEEFLGLIETHKIKKIADVRTIPGSRRNPQFNKIILRNHLKKRGILYLHLKELGGLRKPKKDSVNNGWKNLSFRGFADYMLTEEFVKGLEILERNAKKGKTAIMCAESVPWRCHRSLIADAMLKRKWKVFHIQGRNALILHKPTSFLRVKEGKIIYPGNKTYKSR